MAQNDKVYEKVSLYKSENGNMVTVPGDSDIGDKIEIGHMEEPVRAECRKVFNLPEKMGKEQFREWVNRQNQNPESLLMRNKRKIEDEAEDVETYRVELQDASIEVKAEDEEQARKRANGVYRNKKGAKLETDMLGEVWK